MASPLVVVRIKGRQERFSSVAMGDPFSRPMYRTYHVIGALTCMSREKQHLSLARSEKSLGAIDRLLVGCLHLTHGNVFAMRSVRSIHKAFCSRTILWEIESPRCCACLSSVSPSLTSVPTPEKSDGLGQCPEIDQHAAQLSPYTGWVVHVVLGIRELWCIRERSKSMTHYLCLKLQAVL